MYQASRVGRVQAEAFNGDIYLRKCLDYQIILYPNLASCHYGRETRDWLATKGINIVPKTANATNAPQVKLNEEFWSLLNRKVPM